MPRIPPARLSAALAPARTPLVRAISTTAPASSSQRTEWVRNKLWKGAAPGPADPYTQRVEEKPKGGEYTPVESRDIKRFAKPTLLNLPLPKRETTHESEIEVRDPTYVPSLSLDELEPVAPLKRWWDQPGNWGEESKFKAFGHAVKVTDAEVVEVYLRRALIEVLAVQQTGKMDEWASKKWLVGMRKQLDEALAVEIRVNAGVATLVGDASAVAESATIRGQGKAREHLSAEEASEMIKAWDPSWKEITLDHVSKFTLRKRLFQLTGNLLPDGRLAAARTVQQFLTLATKSPKPPKLAEELQLKGQFEELSNVRVHDRKIGPVEKETAVGRWKVIEEELRKRDLPVLGKAGLRPAKELRWLNGRE